MKVIKFGGASVKDADTIKNIPGILKNYPNEKLVIILSAMGKTTNALELLVEAFYNSQPDTIDHFDQIKQYHLNITKDLFENPEHPVYSELNLLFKELETKITKGKDKAFDANRSFNFIYDQIVSFGEMFSTKLVSYYLDDTGFSNNWFDVRKLIKTDNSFREGKVDWKRTENLIKNNVTPILSSGKYILTQGFIASNLKGESVTLGREGSDFTASIFASVLDADEVILWKDVPGLMNADPKDFKETKMINQISYGETIELAFYGVKVIHPKTIKPLQNKKIPLKIKSFLSPGDIGSLIHTETHHDSQLPLFIFKQDQILLSISPKDFSFMAEENLHFIFGLFAQYKIKINMMQNSAISFSVCVDKKDSLEELIKNLKKNYMVKYNEDLELITIRHYTKEAIDKVKKDRYILLEQRSRSTIQLVVK